LSSVCFTSGNLIGGKTEVKHNDKIGGVTSCLPLAGVS